MQVKYPWDGQDAVGSQGGAGGRPVTDYLSFEQFWRQDGIHRLDESTVRAMYAAIGGGSRRHELSVDALQRLHEMFPEA